MVNAEVRKVWSQFNFQILWALVPHQKICEFRPLLLSGQSGSDSSMLLLKPSDYVHNNAVLLRNHGRPRFWELFFVLGILKDRNNSLVFINRNSFSGRTSYLLIESFLPYQKIAISSGVVEFSRVFAVWKLEFFTGPTCLWWLISHSYLRVT